MSLTVLFVDDEIEVLDALRRTLRHEGYRLLCAGSGEEALLLLAREKVDVVVTDGDMPGMKGLELLGRLRALDPAIVRIMLTGAATLESALQAINRGEVHRYLTKPWSKTDLADALKDAGEKRAELLRTAAATSHERRLDDERARLEARYPGLTRVDRRDGVYFIDADRVLSLRARLEDTPLASLLFP